MDSVPKRQMLHQRHSFVVKVKRTELSKTRAYVIPKKEEKPVTKRNSTPAEIEPETSNILLVPKKIVYQEPKFTIQLKETEQQEPKVIVRDEFTDNQQVLHDFCDYFPKIDRAMTKFRDYAQSIDGAKLSAILDSELLNKHEVADFWIQLAKVNCGSVLQNVAKQVLSTYGDARFRHGITPFEQNVLKWTVLFLEIEKKGSPLFRGNDHVHPFSSARTMLIIFEKYNIIQVKTDEHRKLFAKILLLLEESQQPLENVERGQTGCDNVCRKVHSHHFLQKIFSIMWQSSFTECTGGRFSFVDLVFRLILFHQSHQEMTKQQPMVSLNDWEQLKFCDPEYYKLSELMQRDEKSKTSEDKALQSDVCDVMENRIDASMCGRLQYQDWQARAINLLSPQDSNSLPSSDRELSQLQELNWFSHFILLN